MSIAMRDLVRIIFNFLHINGRYEVPKWFRVKLILSQGETPGSALFGGLWN